VTLLDSSLWIDFFRGGSHREAVLSLLRSAGAVLVPTVCLSEVPRFIERTLTSGDALRAATAMRAQTVVDLTADLAVQSARIGLQHRLPLADSIIYATARMYDASLWTMDTDFQGLPEVVLFD
jgi:predicted nucleic acid-binding protein